MTDIVPESVTLLLRVVLSLDQKTGLNDCLSFKYYGYGYLLGLIDRRRCKLAALMLMLISCVNVNVN